MYIDLPTNSHIVGRLECTISQEDGVSMLDAPVSSGVIGASTGLMAVMVGSYKTVNEQVKPALNARGDNVVDHAWGDSSNAKKAGTT